MWEAFNGEPIPEGKIILHSCDNPSCVNPNHLRVGTWGENMQDRSDRMRNVGGKHGQKLTKEQIDFIINSDLRNFELAKMFNVCAPSIRYHRQKARLQNN